MSSSSFLLSSVVIVVFVVVEELVVGPSCTLLCYLKIYLQGKSCLSFRSGNSSKEVSWAKYADSYPLCVLSGLLHIILYIVNDHLLQQHKIESRQILGLIKIYLITTTYLFINWNDMSGIHTISLKVLMYFLLTSC